MKAAELGRSCGGLTCKIHFAADRRCRPLAFVLTPGQAGDSPQFVPVLERIKVVIPEKVDQAANRKKRGSAGGRPVDRDTTLYGDRNTV